MKQKGNIKDPETRNCANRPRHHLARPCQVARMGARSCALLPARVFAYFAHVVRRFALVGARGFFDPLIFLELAFEVLFSIETRWFLLK